MKNFFRILAYLKSYKSNAGFNILFNVFATVFSILSFLVLKPFLDILFGQLDDGSVTDMSGLVGQISRFLNGFLVDYIQAHGKPSGLVIVCVIVVITFFLKNLFRYLALFVMAPVRNGIQRDIRREVFAKLMILPLSYFTEERKGDLMSRITSDVQEIQWSVLRALEVIVRSPVAIVGSLVVMLDISWRLTSFAFVLILFIGIIIGRIGKTLRKQSSKAQSSLGNLLSILEEALGGLRIIKGFTAENYQGDKFEAENQTYFRITTSMMRRKDLSSPLTEFLGITVVVVLLWYGGTLVFEGSFDASTFIVFVMMFYNIIDPAKSFSTAMYDIQKGIAAAERVNHILDAEVKIKAAENPKSLAQFTQDIEYRDVHFAYQDEEPVLSGVQLRIPKGKVVALVGASGAGKSTLVDLLPRFFDVTQGAILIDGIDIRQYELRQLRSLMGIVSQEAILFNDSIYNNIAFGVEATPEQIEEAARIAHAHEFISQFPEGYQTRIGDRGTKLSGGQRQRITIARAVLKNPPILLLDEATSALDSESERLVQDALIHLMKDRTAIVVAHRLSTIQHADEIIVMERGQIIERGTHQSLLTAGGTYKKLVELQSV